MKKLWSKLEWRVSIIYAVFGFLWILTSDDLVASLVQSIELEHKIQNYKGWLFVLLSAILIFLTLKNAWGKQKEMESMFQKLFETSLDGILLTAPNGEIYAANPAACRLLGLTEEEIIQVGRNGIVDTEDPRLAIALEKRESTGSFSGELTMIRGDGSKLEVEMSSVVFSDHFGNPRTNIVFRDLTERKLKEKQLLEINSRFSQVLDSMTDAFIILDPNWRIIYANQEAARINKKKVEEFVGKIHWEEWPATVGTLVEEKYRWAMQKRKPVHFENHYYDEGLYNVWLDVHAYPYEQGLAVYYHDITETKLLGNQLAHLNKRLNETLEGMTDSFILLDRDWRITYLNAQAIKGQDVPVNEIMGKSHWDVWPMTIGTNVEKQYRLAIESGQPVHFEHHYFARGEYDEWHDIHAYPSEDGLAIFFADITARKKAEEALQKLNRDLEKRVKARTAELELRNRELETFTYTVSHDLKAPLRGIDGYSRLLYDQYKPRLDEEGKFFLDNIRKAAGQMSQLIDDLLQYSRLERRSISSTPVDLQEIVDRLLQEKEKELEKHHFEISVELECRNLRTDSDGLIFALRNLIDNAIKFSSRVDVPKIDISSSQKEDSCIIMVEDNGIGFDMKFSEKIFEIFQRLHRVEEYPGTGIGLAIVSKVMERIGGRAWAESEPGMGAKFYLEVPL